MHSSFFDMPVMFLSLIDSCFHFLAIFIIFIFVVRHDYFGYFLQYFATGFAICHYYFHISIRRLWLPRCHIITPLLLRDIDILILRHADYCFHVSDYYDIALFRFHFDSTPFLTSLMPDCHYALISAYAAAGFRHYVDSWCRWCCRHYCRYYFRQRCRDVIPLFGCIDWASWCHWYHASLMAFLFHLIYFAIFRLITLIFAIVFFCRLITLSTFLPFFAAIFLILITLRHCQPLIITLMPSSLPFLLFLIDYFLSIWYYCHCCLSMLSLPLYWCRCFSLFIDELYMMLIIFSSPVIIYLDAAYFWC